MHTSALFAACALLLQSPSPTEDLRQTAPETTAHARYSESVRALNKAFTSGDVLDVWDYISPDFELKGSPATEYLHLLHKTFSQAKGKVRNAKVTKFAATQTGHTLTLDAEGGIAFTATVDKNGDITSLSFIRPTVAAKPTLEIESANDFSIPMVTQGKHRLVEGKVNGVEGYFLIDTGAPHGAINADLFPDLKGKQVEALGINGGVNQSQYVTVDSLSFGGATFKNLEVVSQPMSNMQLGHKKLKRLGLLGHRELSEFDMTFDYANNLLYLSKLDQHGNRLTKSDFTTPKQQYRFKFANHLPVIDCELDGQKLRLGLDTGAESTVIDKTLKSRFENLLKNKRTVFHSGGDGNFEMTAQGELPLLTIEGKAYKNVKTLFTSFDHLNAGETGMKLHGLLGAEYLERAKLFGLNLRKREITIW